MMGKPADYRRRGDWGDLPFAICLGIMNTELQWAIGDGDVAKAAELRDEITHLEGVIEKFKVTPAKQPGT